MKTRVISTAFIFVACACGVSAGAPPTDACTTLSAERVGAVLGVAVGAGEHLLPNSTASCGWAQPTDPNHTGKRVVVEIYGPLGKLSPVDRFESAKKPMEGITKSPVTGVGDDAVFVTTPGFGTGLTVKKGTAVFQVRVYGFPEAEIKAKEKALAAEILGKL